MALYQVDRGAEAYPPFPQEHHGIVWRQLGPHDLHALSALFARMEARDNPPYRTALAEVEEMLSPASSWWGIAAFATKGIAQGRMVAFAQTRLRFQSVLNVSAKAELTRIFVESV